MRDLESSAEVSRNLYSSLLQKFQEISAAHTQEIGVQDVRVVTRAAPPLQKSSSRAMLVLAGSVAVGLFLGAGAVIGKEWVADVFRTPHAVTRATGIHSVVLPFAVETVERARAARTDGKPSSIEEFVLDQPYSRFAETLRSVKAMINATQDAEQRQGDWYRLVHREGGQDDNRSQSGGPGYRRIAGRYARADYRRRPASTES